MVNYWIYNICISNAYHTAINLWTKCWWRTKSISNCSSNIWIYIYKSKKIWLVTNKLLYLDIQLLRQDDCNQSLTDFIKFCQDYKSNPNTEGICITYMGTGIPNYATSALNSLKELGPEYQPIVIFSSGK